MIVSYITQVLTDYRFVIPVLISAASFIYTWKSNQSKITAIEFDIVKENDKHDMFVFTVHNISKTPIVILDIALHEQNGKLVTDSGFIPKGSTLDVPPYFSHQFAPLECEFSNPFKRPSVLAPFDKTVFSYFIRDSIPNNVVITCDQRINCFKRSKSFPVHFYQ